MSRKGYEKLAKKHGMEYGSFYLTIGYADHSLFSSGPFLTWHRTENPKLPASVFRELYDVEQYVISEIAHSSGINDPKDLFRKRVRFKIQVTDIQLVDDEMRGGRSEI